MAPFNKRQIGYIKAVAGVGQHVSYQNYSNAVPDGDWTSYEYDSTITNGDYADKDKYVQKPQRALTAITTALAPNFEDSAKSLAGAVFCLNNIPLTSDHTDTSTNINDWALTQYKFQKALVPNKMLLLTQGNWAEGAENKVHDTRSRVGEDFYIDSTHVRWRFTMPDFTVESGKQPHHEYRFIVFRQRKPTLQRDSARQSRDGQWLNWNYDLFSGYEGRRVGLAGVRTHDTLDADERYFETAHQVNTVPWRSKLFKLTVDDVMTLPLNDADYVIMRDERFFLGAEHGKSHYETVTHFDFTDPGSTGDYNLVDGMDEGKNYDWWFLILGTTNDSVVPQLNISVRGTTKITSA